MENIDPQTDPGAAFLEAACVPLEGASYEEGNLDGARLILSKHPDVAASSIYTAAVLGDEVAVRRFLNHDPRLASAKGGVRNWDALTYLCFSRYLRLDAERSAGIVATAKALLDAGASANTGWFEPRHLPTPMFESVMYAAAGLAHNAEMTRLLLDYGADPNDDETPYHAAEGYDLAALRVLVESGKLNSESLSTILLRKADWHDLEGIQYLLEHGADPNRMTQWHHTALHWAIRRDNDIEILESLLDHGANPDLANEKDGRSATAMAAHKGRGDVLASLKRRGIPVRLEGVDLLIAACARGDETARELARQEPQLRSELLSRGGTLLAEFAGKGNVEGVRLLLDLGVDPGARFAEGDPYFNIAKDSTALHSAAWRMRHQVVRLLLERGAPVDVIDAKGRTPLWMAVRCCVSSHWAQRRSPESVRLLLSAGASAAKAEYPCGYEDVDGLLRQARQATS